jgi:hypothetical protein
VIGRIDFDVDSDRQINDPAASGRGMEQPFFSKNHTPRGGECTLDKIQDQIACANPEKPSESTSAACRL